MRHILLPLLLLLMAPTARADTKAQADSLYAAARYEAAIQAYEHLLDPEEPQADILYNIGNCHYKLGDIPHALLCYERALVLKPSDADIRANLRLARTKTPDKQAETSEMFFITWWKQAAMALPLPAYALIAVACFILLLLSLLLCIFLRDVSWRKRCLHAAGICLVICLLANLALFTQYNLLARHDGAIVIAPSLTVKSSPDERSMDLFIVHEGTKLRILDNSMSQWLEVKLEEGKQGWVPRTALEII